MESKTPGQVPLQKYGLNVYQDVLFDLKKIARPSTEKAVVLREEASSARVMQSSGISAELQSHPRFNEFFHHGASIQNDEFFQAHKAVVHDSIFIHLPAKSDAKTIRVTYDVAETLVGSILLLAEEGSAATLIINQKGNPAAHISRDIRIIADQKSKVNVIVVKESGLTLEWCESHVGKGAQVTYYTASIGEEYSRTRIRSELDAVHAKATVSMLLIGEKAHRFDVQNSAIHNVAQTVSMMTSKEVMNDRAKSLSRGLIKIHRGAQGSQARESQNALLLSSEAEADHLPFLEIENHDVACKHSASVGHLNADQVFYLMSRGLSEDEARRMIIEGYCAGFLCFLPEDLQERVREKIGAL